MNVHFNLEHRFMKKEQDYVSYMDYIPDYSDKNFIGPRSIFASILYFILACFNYFLALAYFAFIRELYSNHAKISSILICCFICYNLFFLIRELNFKILHWCGYHALPKYYRFGRGRFPLFNKITKTYKRHYRRRSRKHQFLFLLSYLLYLNLVPICLFIYFYFIIHFNKTDFNNENKIYSCIIFILLFVLIYILELLFKRYRKWFTKHFNLDDRLEEHEFPIFFLKEK